MNKGCVTRKDNTIGNLNARISILRLEIMIQVFSYIARYDL